MYTKHTPEELLKPYHRELKPCAVDKFRVAITGTSGKTTVSLVLSKLLSSFFGDKVGCSTSSGVRVGHRVVIDTEHKASEQYPILLNDEKLKYVISEQPLTGIFAYGLPINHHYGIINNISKDHLHMNYIRHGMWDITKIKSYIAKTSVKGAIISVDYSWTRNIIDYYQQGQINILAFGRSKRYVEEYLKAGYQVVTVEKNLIKIKTPGKKDVVVGSKNDFALTCNGALDYNVENLLPIISLIYNSKELKLDFKVAIEELKKIGNDFDTNPFRFNVFDYENTKIIIDYAHNLEKYRLALKALNEYRKTLSGKPLVAGLVAVADDRGEGSVAAIAKVISRGLDKIFVRKIKGNEKVTHLFNQLKKHSVETEYAADDFKRFIEDNYKKYDILYITLAGRGKIKDLKKNLEELKIL